MDFSSFGKTLSALKDSITVAPEVVQTMQQNTETLKTVTDGLQKHEETQKSTGAAAPTSNLNQYITQLDTVATSFRSLAAKIPTEIMGGKLASVLIKAADTITNVQGVLKQAAASGASIQGVITSLKSITDTLTKIF